MEQLSSAAQVASIITGGVVTCIFFIAVFTNFFDNVGRRK